MDPADNIDEESPRVNTDEGILISAIESTGDEEALELLYSRRTFSQAELDTALILACRHGYKYLVYALIHLEANVQTSDGNGNTPLLICAENGFTNMAKFLMRRKVNINAANYVGDTALILAIGRAGSVEMVKLLLAQTGINVNHQNKEGYTALMKAIEAMDIDVIKLLLDSQKNAPEVLHGIKNCRNETAQEIADKLGIGEVVRLLPDDGSKVCNPFLAAVLACDADSLNILMDCQFWGSSDRKHIVQDCFKAVIMTHEKSGENFSKNEEKIIQRLLESGADVNELPGSCNPLIIATRVGNYNVCQMLLKHVNLDLSNLKQKDLLALSAEHGHTQIVELLLKHNPKLVRSGFTTPALHTAMKKGHAGCINVFTKHVASIDVKSAFKSAMSSRDVVHLKFLVDNFKVMIKRHFSLLDMSDFLVSAARSGDLDIIDLLLDAGANVNSVCNENKTPLMESKNAEVVNFLVQKGAIVNRYRKGSNQVYSPLTYVLSNSYYQPASADKEKIVEALLKHQACVNGKSSGGRTPLMVAVASRSSRNIIQMLLDHGADVTCTDSKGGNVLMMAVDRNSNENVECLLQHKRVKSVINAKTWRGLTALMSSVISCNHVVMKTLIDHGADVNIQDADGNSALLLAVSKNIPNPGVLSTLVEAGSDVNVQNKSGYSPLMLAATLHMKDAVVLFVDSGANVNAVSEKFENETALSLMLKNHDFKSSCVEYLLDHGARVSYLEPPVLLQLIQWKRIIIIPKLIQCGLGPAEIATSTVPHYEIPPLLTETVSPLCMALLTGNVRLARYLLGNLFVTKNDMLTLINSQHVRQFLYINGHRECWLLLNRLTAQPLSLFSAAFIAVQAAVGSAPGRLERISTLPLPQALKDRLGYKVETVPLDPSDDKLITLDGRPTYVLEANETYATVRYDDDDDYYVDVANDLVFRF